MMFASVNVTRQYAGHFRQFSKKIFLTRRLGLTKRSVNSSASKTLFPDIKVFFISGSRLLVTRCSYSILHSLFALSSSLFIQQTEKVPCC